MLEIAREIQNTLEGYELCSLQAGEVSQLVQRLENREVTIAVIGQFKRGKTTMVNRILGSDILPVGIVPITAAVTRIRYREDAEEDTARVWFLNGLGEDVPVEELHSYISEQENHDNQRGVAEVELYTKADFLKDGLVLVDTPGVGSIHEKNSKSAYDFARESDGVIFLLSVDSPINQIEIDFLRDTRRFAGKFYFAVNKIDTIDEEELEEYLRYCNQLICGIMEIAPESEEAEAVRLIPISAKKDTGIDALKRLIQEDLVQNSDRIMEQSAARKLLEILKGTRAQIRSYREVLKMAPNVFHRRFEEMHEDLQQRIADCEALPGTESGSTGEAQADRADRRPAGFSQEPQINSAGQPKMYLRARLNEEKAAAAARVRELFGIEYYYGVSHEDASQLLRRDEYVAELTAVYRDLEKTMQTIFMYKEENAYTVARRIEDLNILLHTMDRQQRAIERSGLATQM